jgi:hypothetical protein
MFYKLLSCGASDIFIKGHMQSLGQVAEVEPEIERLNQMFETYVRAVVDPVFARDNMELVSDTVNEMPVAFKPKSKKFASIADSRDVR